MATRRFTDDERARAVEASRRICAIRRDIRVRMKAGEIPVRESISMDALKGMRLRTWILSQKGIGVPTSEMVLRRVGLRWNRRLRSLGVKQKDAVAEAVELIVKGGKIDG